MALLIKQTKNKALEVLAPGAFFILTVLDFYHFFVFELELPFPFAGNGNAFQ